MSITHRHDVATAGRGADCTACSRPVGGSGAVTDRTPEPYAKTPDRGRDGGDGRRGVGVRGNATAGADDPAERGR